MGCDGRGCCGGCWDGGCWDGGCCGEVWYEAAAVKQLIWERYLYCHQEISTLVQAQALALALALALFLCRRAARQGLV